VIRLPGRFRFKGTAIGAGGRITTPFKEPIEVQAAAALPEIGGYGSARSSHFHHREFLRFDLAHSEVIGSRSDEDDEKAVFSTLIKSTVEGLNIMGMITADRIVANLVTSFKYGEDQPSVKLIGSRCENLRVAGIPIKVVFATDILDKHDTHKSMREAYGTVERVRDLFGDAALKERFPKAPSKVARWFCHPFETPPETEAKPQMPEINGISHVSLVRHLEPDGDGLDCWGHVIRVEGFGVIRLGEVSISPLSRSVTMLHVVLGSPVTGAMMCCSAEDGCDPG
jgi:hypothetical protein